MAKQVAPAGPRKPADAPSLDDLYVRTGEAPAPAAEPDAGRILIRTPDGRVLEANDKHGLYTDTPATGGRRQTPVGEVDGAGYKAGGRRPARDLEDVAPVRLTAYLRPDQLERLRAEVWRRQRGGKRADVSALLREAVDAMFPPK